MESGKFSLQKIKNRLTEIRLFLNKFISFLISTSLFLAINGSFKIYFSNLLFNEFIISTSLMTFLITFGTYGLNKLTDLKEDAINTPERDNYIKRIKLIFKYSVVFSFISSLLIGLSENALTLPILLFPLFIGILYSVKFSKNIPRLKDITGIKNISIALTWAVGSTFLPVVYLVEIKKNILVLLIFFFFFLKSYINSILFDISDIEGDRVSEVRTIPVLVGVNRTKKLLLLLNTTLIPWLIFSYLKGFFHKYLYILFFSIFYGYWYILHFCKEGKKRGKSLDLLVDGEWILILGFILIFEEIQLSF